MDLVEERLAWYDSVKKGEYPKRASIILEQYRDNRYEENFRMSSVVEQLCEVIFCLEDRIQELETNMSRYKND